MLHLEVAWVYELDVLEQQVWCLAGKRDEETRPFTIRNGLDFWTASAVLAVQRMVGGTSSIIQLSAGAIQPPTPTITGSTWPAAKPRIKFQGNGVIYLGLCSLKKEPEDEDNGDDNASPAWLEFSPAAL